MHSGCRDFHVTSKPDEMTQDANAANSMNTDDSNLQRLIKGCGILGFYFLKFPRGKKILNIPKLKLLQRSVLREMSGES